MTVAERDDDPVVLDKSGGDMPAGSTIDMPTDPHPPEIDEDGRTADIDLVDDDDDTATELERVPDPWAPTAARNAVERYLARPLPTLVQMWATSRWWATTVVFLLLPRLLLLALPTLLGQIRPTLRGIDRGLRVWAAWRCGSDWLGDVKAAEGNERAKRRSEWERQRRSRNRASLAVIVVAVTTVFVSMSLWPVATWVAIGLALVGFDTWGHKGAEPVERGGILPSAPLREGAPLRVIIPQVIDVLAGRGHDATVVNPSAGDYGVVMDLHTVTEVDDKDLEALERGMQTYPGAVSRIQSTDNAAVGQLRIMWKDPLAQIHAPPLWAPLSQSVNNPGDLGYGIGAAPLLITFLRTNILVIGGPGSGKSSCLWCMIDYLTACRDVVVDGIDLSGGPALDAWGDCIRHLATDRAEAREVLKDALDLADRRTRKIGGRSRPQRGGGPVGPENWGTADGRTHIIFIDELPLLATDKELLELYCEHLRVGRKAASTSVAVAQDVSGDTIKATSVRKYPTTTVLLACSREDIVATLGGGKIKEGWCPHRLVPAEGDDPNDAGKGFIHSGRHRSPNPWRFNRLDDMGDIHERAFARIDAGMPQIDDDGPDVLDGFVLPEELHMVHTAFTSARWPEFMATDDLLVSIAGERGSAPTAAKLAELLKDWHLAPDQTRRRSGGAKNPRKGYLADAVRAAVDQAAREAAGTGERGRQ